MRIKHIREMLMLMAHNNVSKDVMARMAESAIVALENEQIRKAKAASHQYRKELAERFKMVDEMYNAEFKPDVPTKESDDSEFPHSHDCTCNTCLKFSHYYN